MTRRELQRKSFKVSLALHGSALVLILVLPWILQACQRRRPAEKLMFVEFTVALPPAPAPETTPAPEPEPPKPKPSEDIKIPEKTPEPPKPPRPPPRDIRQTNRVVRRPDAPPPRGPTLSEAEIARLLRQGARISDTTSIPTGQAANLGAYYNHIHERMYAAWTQPAQLKNLPGLRTVVTITVQPNGTITGRRLDPSSGNTLMDDSVMKAVNAVKALRPLPAGLTSSVDIDITFELSD